MDIWSANPLDLFQIGVWIGPGSTAATWMPEGAKLEPQGVGDRLQREFRGTIRTEIGRCLPAAVGTDVDDPPAGLPQQREKRLRHRDLADHVDFELSSPGVQGHKFHRARNGDAGVIDQAGQPGVADGLAHRLGRGGDRGGVRHVDHQRSQSRGRLGPQVLGRGLRTHPGEDAEAEPIQFQGARLSNAARSARNDNCGWRHQ